MTTPGDYPSQLVASLWGGVRENIENNVVAEDTAALTAAQGQAMSAEDQRRLLASARPGHGAQVPLPQPPGGPGVGISDVPIPVVGEGYENGPGASEAQVAAYTMPNYADDSVGGVGFQAGRQEPPVRVLVAGRSAPGSGAVVISPDLVPARRGLLGRLLGRRRK